VHKALRKFVTLTDYTSKLSGEILSLVILLMIGIVMYEVVARYIFNSPTSWSLEAATMAFGTYMIGGGAYAVLHKAHVSMDIFSSKWTKRTRAVVECCTYPLAAVYFSVMCWQAVAYGIESMQINEHASSVWGPPIYHWKLITAMALILLWLQLASDFIRNLVLACSGEELS
jgi:TRAP-type mannitol/chloroaromatic compound transport system permease small subunit